MYMFPSCSPCSGIYSSSKFCPPCWQLNSGRAKLCPWAIAPDLPLPACLLVWSQRLTLLLKPALHSLLSPVKPWTHNIPSSSPQVARITGLYHNARLPIIFVFLSFWLVRCFTCIHVNISRSNWFKAYFVHLKLMQNFLMGCNKEPELRMAWYMLLVCFSLFPKAARLSSRLIFVGTDTRILNMEQFKIFYGYCFQII